MDEAGWRNEAYFQIRFSQAYGNHLLRMKCHMKAKTLDIKAMILICIKRLPKSSNIHSKLSFARANENLVAPLSIVLTQSCINYEH